MNGEMTILNMVVLLLMGIVTANALWYMHDAWIHRRRKWVLVSILSGVGAVLLAIKIIIELGAR